MTERTLSIIIPAYNEEKYVGHCLESIFADANEHLLEVIVVDNASTDRTAEVASSYPGVRVVHENWRGVTRARERGFRESRGTLLAFLDADTRLPHGWIQNIVDTFATHPDLVCASGPYDYYDSPFWFRYAAMFYWNYVSTPISWFIGYTAIGGNMTLTREVLENMHGFDTSIEFYGDDTDTARRAHAFGRVWFSPRFVLYSSNRRFRSQGILDTTYVYLKGFFVGVFLHRPPKDSYKNFR